MFHTDVVVDLACGLRMSLCARALKVATIFAAAVCCLRGRQHNHASRKREQEDDRDLHTVSQGFLVFSGRVRTRACGFVYRRAQSARQLFGVVVRPKMQEEQPWLLIQHVAVNGRHLNAV